MRRGNRQLRQSTSSAGSYVLNPTFYSVLILPVNLKLISSVNCTMITIQSLVVPMFTTYLSL
jgi:hypothetical protein